MQALIDPRYNNRICQVQEDSFVVAEPLFWTECPENCTTEWTYNGSEFIPPPPVVITAEDNKTIAESLLQATDWTTIPDVGDPTKSNPYLMNVDDFITYRNAVRQYAVFPVAGNIDWPVVPTEQWSS